jgi:hypothetical protein
MTGHDVGGALAQGAPAVEVLTDYVAACRALGHYAADPGQLQDAYTAEDGMDLGALDADRAAIATALQAVDEAVRLQDGAQAALADAWQGPAADAANRVIAQHAQSSALAETALRRVADTLGELRDTLWQLVSGKVTAVQDIEDRAEREQWWPAARAVTTGAGAQDTASEIVDGKVNPFVTVAIGSEWADVMESTQRSVRDAYDAAAAGISADPPGFGAPAATLPAAAAPEPLPAPVAAADPFGGALPASGLGAGMSTAGAGFAGIGQQLADLIGGLLNTGSGVPGGDPLDLDEPDGGDLEPGEDGDPDDEMSEDPDDDKADDGTAEEAEAEKPAEPAPDAVSGSEPAVPQPIPPIAGSAPEPAAAPAQPPVTAAVPEPVPEPARAPCEIAADELPQAGE